MNAKQRRISQPPPDEVELAETFLTEVIASFAGLEIYRDAHDTLTVANSCRQLHAFRFFRAWLRRKEIAPDSVLSDQPVSAEDAASGHRRYMCRKRSAGSWRRTRREGRGVWPTSRKAGKFRVSVVRGKGQNDHLREVY
jgi:hypothetical protein